MDQPIYQQRQARISVDELVARQNIRYCSFCSVQWGQSGNETEIFSGCCCFDTFGIAYIRSAKRRHRRVVGGKQGGRALPALSAGEPEGSVHQDLQGICSGRWPFSLCDDPLCSDHVVIHHLRRAPECVVAESGGRTGDEILSRYPQPLQGHNRWRLRDRCLKVGRRLAGWRRPSQTREAPCSPRS